MFPCSEEEKEEGERESKGNKERMLKVTEEGKVTVKGQYAGHYEDKANKRSLLLMNHRSW